MGQNVLRPNTNLCNLYVRIEYTSFMPHMATDLKQFIYG